MRSVAKASHNRSISELKKVLSKYEKELKEDPIISAHLEKLYDNLLEKNLLRVIEPFSKVQVSQFKFDDVVRFRCITFFCFLFFVFLPVDIIKFGKLKFLITCLKPRNRKARSKIQFFDITDSYFHLHILFYNRFYTLLNSFIFLW